MIMRDAVVEGSGNFDHLGFFNVHLNLSTRASNIFASTENAAAAAGIRSHISDYKKRSVASGIILFHTEKV